MKTLAVLKLISFMCDNNSTLVITERDGFIGYSLYGGHASSGIAFCITNLDRDGMLPTDWIKGETPTDFANQVAKLIKSKRLSKDVVKITVSQKIGA